MTKFIYLILLFSLPIQALQVLQPTNDNQVIQQQLNTPQLNTSLSAEQLLTKLKTSAKRGDARSQFSLANMYHNGINITKDDKLAFYWYLQVAEQNYASAQFNVAHGYYYGIGVGKDLEQALYWYEKSAQQGHPKAQYQLYLIYNKGDAVAKNEMLAKTYLLKAAQTGHAQAQYQLGKSFFNQGMAKEATYYLELAANQNNTSAAKLLKKLSFKPQQAVQHKQEKSDIQNIANMTKPAVTIEPIMAKMLPQSMTPLPVVDFNLNQPLFNNTIPLIPSQDKIAKSLSHNTKSNVSLKTLLASVEQGDPIAQYNLSLLYAKGEVVRKDNTRAFILMRQSANQGITQSQNALAIMYMKGAGVEINYDKAYYWSSITTRKGSQEGKLILLYLIANL